MHCQHLDTVFSNLLWETSLRRRLSKSRIAATAKVELMEMEVALLNITHDCHKSEIVFLLPGY